MSVGVLYLPGLKGDNQFKPGFPAAKGPYYSGVIRTLCSQQPDTGFRHLEYQTQSKPFPLISAASAMAWQHVGALGVRHDAVIGVGSSAGAGILLEGVSRHVGMGGKPPHALVLIGPIYDPISSVMQLAGKEMCARLAAGAVPSLPLQVSCAPGQPNPGVYPLTQAHMTDPGLVSLLRHGANPETLAGRAMQTLREAGTKLVIFTSEDDRYSSPAAARAFLGLFRRTADETNLQVWKGGHNDDGMQRFADVSARLQALIIEARAVRPTPVEAAAPVATNGQAPR